MRRNSLFDQHTLDILKAAMPHVHPRAQSEMNVLLKANDLIDTISGQGGNDEVSAMELQNWKSDPEELLVSIKGVLNEGETEIADMMLNFMKARRIYNAYQTYTDDILQAQSFSNKQSNNNGTSKNNNNGNSRRNPFGNMNNSRYRSQGNNNNSNGSGMSGQNASRPHASSVNAQQGVESNKGTNGRVNQMGGNGQPNFMNFLMSQLTPEQKKTVEMFNMMMNNMPSDMGSMSGQNIKSQQINEEDNTINAQNVSAEEPQTDNVV